MLDGESRGIASVDKTNSVEMRKRHDDIKNKSFLVGCCVCCRVLDSVMVAIAVE